MPIVEADLTINKSVFVGSGGVDSLGGAITATELTSGVLHELFDVVTPVEAGAGMTDYRCIYIKNTHATLTYEAAAVWIATNTPSADTTASIGLDTAGLDADAETVVDENTAPATAVFTEPVEGAPLAIGDIVPGGFIALWIRRVVSPSAGAAVGDSVVIGFTGTSEA